MSELSLAEPDDSFGSETIATLNDAAVLVIDWIADIHPEPNAREIATNAMTLLIGYMTNPDMVKARIR